MKFKFRPIPKDIKNKRIFLRVDFNMPYAGAKFSDEFRFNKTLSTIKSFQKTGAKIILASHLETGDTHPSFKKFEKFFSARIKKFHFSKQLIGAGVRKKTLALKPGGVLMLENLRVNPGEKKNNPIFAKKLAALGDIYVNEAFSASHRPHASVAGITKFLPSFAGPLFKEEIKNLSRVFYPPHLFLAIVGGNKLSTKSELLKKFLKKADRIVIGGALASSFLRGKEKKFKSKKIFLPEDVVVERKGKRTILDTNKLEKSDVIYDLGPKTMKEIFKSVKKSRFVLWNGPLGWVEGGFTESTKELAKILFKSKAEVIIGGGDTAAFLRKHKFDKKFPFISTGGGAMLEFLAKETLPGIRALK